jgi:hypothetical protein
MDLAEALTEQLAAARRVVTSGSTVIPAWRIGTPDGEYLILTQYDETKPEQRERGLYLIGRFMAWKLATSFVLTAEGTHRDDRGREHEHLIGAGISSSQVIGARQRITRKARVEFGHLEPFQSRDAVDPVLLALLPAGQSSVDEKEARLLASLFGEDGEMPAHRLN